MKKSYIQPSITLVKTDTENLLAEFSTIGIDSTTEYKTEDMLSKNHHKDSLWDTSWEDKEEE